MASGTKTVTTYFLTIGGVLLTGLILFAPWQIWAPLTAATALFTAAILITKAIGSHSGGGTNQDAKSADLVESGKQHVKDVLLPSNHEDYYFLFSAMVVWSPMKAMQDESKVNMAALAVEAILLRASEITRWRDPGQASFLRHELGGALARMQADGRGYLQAMAESIQLALPDHDQERLNKLALVRKEKAIWEHERKYEQSKRKYLGEDVLKDAGSAVVWWLARNDDHVEKAVQDIPLLAKLSSTANNTEIPENLRRYMPEFTVAHTPGPDGPRSPEDDKSPTDHFEAFLHSMDFAEDDPGRDMFAHQVAKLATSHGRNEVAEDIVNRFDTAEDAEYPQGVDNGG